MRSITLHVAVLALAASSLGCASQPKPSPVATPVVTPVVANDATTPPAATQPELSTGAPRAPDAAETGLRFAVEPVDAQIAIDGRPYGAVAELAGQGGILNLAPGIYQVSLKATGYVTWRAEVALRAGTETLRVQLTKKP